MIDRRHLAKAGFWAGLLAAVFMALVMLLLRAFAGIPTLTELTSDRAVSFVPVPIFEFMIATFGSWAKRLLFVGLLILQLGLGGLLGAVYASRLGFRVAKGGAWSHGILLSLILWAATVMIGLPALDAGFFGSDLRPGATAVLVGLALVFASYGLPLPWLIRWFAGTPEQATLGVAEPGRRSFVRIAALGLVGVIAGGSLIRMLAEFARAGHFTTPASSKSPEGLPLEVTPNSEFYTVSKNTIDPIVDVRNWKLEVSGLVRQPLTFTYEELKALPSVEQYATLICISNPVGGDLISNALWRGVPMPYLLNRAGVQPGATKVVMYAWDDYSDSIPLAKAMEETTIVAWEMNGQPLPDEHGFPTRVVVPGIYGEKNVKWLTAIKVVDYDHKGFWQQIGWSNTAVIKTMSRIDVPQGGASILPVATVLGGIAFAGDRGVSKVEVSTDDGQTWTEAMARKALSPFTWVLWTREWMSPQPGRYRIKVRATDGRGEVQTAEVTATFPDGASGYHAVVVNVREG